jgi:hypothetical protein
MSQAETRTSLTAHAGATLLRMRMSVEAHVGRLAVR